jgi:hypothetical protein
MNRLGFRNLGKALAINATVNGQSLSGRSLAIDPFSVPNEILHYLINKNDLLDFARKVNSDDHDLMKFTLSPVSTTDQISKSSNTDNNTGDRRHKLV